MISPIRPRDSQIDLADIQLSYCMDKVLHKHGLGPFADIEEFAHEWIMRYDKVMNDASPENQRSFNRQFIHLGDKPKHDGSDGGRWERRMLAAARRHTWKDDELRKSFAGHLLGPAQTGDLPMDGAWMHSTSVGEAVLSSERKGRAPSKQRGTKRRRSSTYRNGSDRKRTRGNTTRVRAAKRRRPTRSPKLDHQDAFPSWKRRDGN